MFFCYRANGNKQTSVVRPRGSRTEGKGPGEEQFVPNLLKMRAFNLAQFLAPMRPLVLCGLHDHLYVSAQWPVVQSTISANLGLPIYQWFWFRLFWLKNLVQILQLKSMLYTRKIC